MALPKVKEKWYDERYTYHTASAAIHCIIIMYNTIVSLQTWSALSQDTGDQLGKLVGKMTIIEYLYVINNNIYLHN